jgi:hypothetical protein
MGILDKVKGLLSRNADKVDTAIDKAGDIVEPEDAGQVHQHGRQGAGGREEGRRQDRPTDLRSMAKLSVSVDVPLPPEKAWECASDLSRYKEWLTIHRVWRSKLPEPLEKGIQIDSIVEVQGMPNAAA